MKHTTLIGLERPSWRARWAELFEYGDLLLLLVRRELLSKYKQTLLGPIWFLVQPLFTSLILFILFSETLRVPTEGVPPILYYLSGLLVWNYLSQSLTTISSSLQAHAGLFKKVYFPKILVPLSLVLSTIMAVGIQGALFLGFYLFYFFKGGGLSFPSLTWGLLPIVGLQVVMLSLGAGLLVASFTVRYRDFHHVLHFGLMLWMYLTPIGYSASAIPSRWQMLLAVNPCAYPIQILRWIFFGVGDVSFLPWIISFCMSVIILGLGLLAFEKIERNLIDTL